MGNDWEQKKIRLLPSRTNPQISVRWRSIGRYSEKSIDLTDVLDINPTLLDKTTPCFRH